MSDAADAADAATVELRVDFDALVTSPLMPHRERTRADGTPWRRPTGWHHAEVVAVVVEALFEPVLAVETPFEPLGRDGWVRYEATVRPGTDALDDERVAVVDRYTPEGDPDRTGGETTTADFDVDDALDRL